MNAYELPWFDPEDEAELRAEAAGEDADSGRTDVLEFPCSDAHPGRLSVALTLSLVDSLGHLLALPCVGTTTSSWGVPFFV